MRKPPPEFLLIDVGNTDCKWSTAGARVPVRLGGRVTTRKVTLAWISHLARKFPAQHVILASVVPKLIPAFRRSFRGRLHLVSGASPALGLTFAYPKPAQLGADRLAAAVAVQAWGQYPAIIVACGTATAFTVLDAQGRLCGGVIAPGLQTQLAALLGATAQLPSVKLQDPKSALAKSTQDAIRAGVVLNFQGGAKEIIRQLSQGLPGRKKPAIILTGGNATHLAKSLDVPHTLRPLLVLEGLLIIGTRLYMPVP